MTDANGYLGSNLALAFRRPPVTDQTPGHWFSHRTLLPDTYRLELLSFKRWDRALNVTDTADYVYV